MEINRSPAATGSTRRRSVIGLAVLAIAGMALAGDLHGQAICSGPHAAPGRPTLGGLRTEAPGAGWVQAMLSHHAARSYYGADGDPRPFGADGRVETSTLFVSAAVGIARGIDVMAQLPVHRVLSSDGAGERSRTGAGDPRLYVRVSPELVGRAQVPIALRAGVKLVGAEFPVDALVIPITEGQRDLEVAVEAGHAFWELPLYVRGWAGYRWRGPNETASREPGNERFGYLAAGGPAGRFRWEMAIEGLSGDTPRQQGFAIPTSRRQLLQVYPSAGVVAGPGILEVGARIPLAGRNFPTGGGMTLGYSLRWIGI
jgi:hypothetical protein